MTKDRYRAPFQFLQRYGTPDSSLPLHAVLLSPLADDTESLQRLRVSPEDCWTCDLYCSFKNRVVSAYVAGRFTPPQVNFWTETSSPNPLLGEKFYFKTAKRVLVRTDIHKTLEFIRQFMEKRSDGHARIDSAGLETVYTGDYILELPT